MYMILSALDERSVPFWIVPAQLMICCDCRVAALGIGEMRVVESSQILASVGITQGLR